MLNVLKKDCTRGECSSRFGESVLNLIVRRIQRSMATQVCSVYLFDPNDQCYVLMASEGLNKEAVGRVRLSATEGLVGTVVTASGTY